MTDSLCKAKTTRFNGIPEFSHTETDSDGFIRVFNEFFVCLRGQTRKRKR